MRITIDNGRKSVDIDIVDTFKVNLLEEVIEALSLLGYSLGEIQLALTSVINKDNG